MDRHWTSRGERMGGSLVTAKRVLAPGVVVKIVQGLAVGKCAVVVERWPLPLFKGGPPMWRVRSDDLVRTRIVREDWLEVQT